MEKKNEEILWGKVSEVLRREMQRQSIYYNFMIEPNMNEEAENRYKRIHFIGQSNLVNIVSRDNFKG